MSNILIKYNKDLSPEENKDLLNKAINILRENSIDCLGFDTYEEAYYYSTIPCILEEIRHYNKRNTEISDIVAEFDEESFYRRLAKDFSNYDDTLSFEEMIDIIQSEIFRKYYTKLYTEEKINQHEIVYNGLNKKGSDLSELEKDLYKEELVNFQVNHKGCRHINRVEIESDELGMKVKFI